MKVVVPKESSLAERRVALVPESAARLIGLGCAVAVERGAGDAAGYTDASYEAVGATTGERQALLQEATLVLCVKPLPESDLGLLDGGATMIGMLLRARRRD